MKERAQEREEKEERERVEEGEREEEKVLMSSSDIAESKNRMNFIEK